MRTKLHKVSSMSARKAYSGGTRSYQHIGAQVNCCWTLDCWSRAADAEDGIYVKAARAAHASRETTVPTIAFAAVVGRSGADTTREVTLPSCAMLAFTF